MAKLLAYTLTERHPDLKSSIALVDYTADTHEDSAFFSLQSYPSLTALDTARFDVILASAVVEHVPDGYTLLRSLFDRLDDGGVFYARTPFEIPLKKVWADFSLRYPMHVHNMGPSFWNRVPERYAFPLELLVSQPSFVCSGFSRKKIVRTCAAYLLKMPARLEGMLRQQPKDYIWEWVGGWEALIQRLR